MAAKSRIAWVNTGLVIDGVPVTVDGATWNFLYGCRKRGEECRNCYAMWDVNRMAGHPNPKVSGGKAALVQLTNGRPNWTGKLLVAEDRLNLPLSWQKPRLIFVNSLSDLFYGGWAGDGDTVPWDVFTRAMDVMYRAPQHIYQVLTKRPGFMADRLMDYARNRVGAEYWEDARAYYEEEFPHVWWGFSAGTQHAFDTGIVELGRCPGAVRWCSMEPLLEAVDLDTVPGERRRKADGGWARVLDWVVPGGESKDGARDLATDWVRGILRTCGYGNPHCRPQHRTPAFVKQLGSPYALKHGLQDKKAEDPAEWPEDLRVRDWPQPAMDTWVERHLRPYLTKHRTREVARG